MGNLLIKRKRADDTLEEFVVAMDKIIGPMKWVEHDSANYINDQYFCATAVGLEVTVAVADTSEFVDYDYWISLSENVGGIRELAFLDGVADVAARAIAVHGYEVLRPKDMFRTGKGGFVYRLKPDVGLMQSERILVEPI